MTRIDRIHRSDALYARDSVSSRVRCPEAVVWYACESLHVGKEQTEARRVVRARSEAWGRRRVVRLTCLDEPVPLL